MDQSPGRIAIGSRVQVAYQPDRDRTFVPLHRAQRRLGHGFTGVAIAEHDAHGLCYEVKFPSGVVITYDREELAVVPAVQEERVS